MSEIHAIGQSRAGLAAGRAGHARGGTARMAITVAPRRATPGWPQALALALGKRPTARGVAARPGAGALGWLPTLSLLAALGLFLVSWAYSGARDRPGAPWIEPAYWCGLLLLFVPSAARLTSAAASRGERLWIVSMLGLGLYLVKVFRSPQGFELHDEFLHYRTADDILRTGRLFADNPLLPVSAHFPGLEIATSALARVGGLSIFVAGIVVLAAARLVLVLALYLAYERAGGSSRLAGIATLLYLCNPKLLFFDAQFSYESLGLPLVALVIMAMVCRAQSRPSDSSRFGLTIVALLGLAAVIVTHHLTSYAFAFFLFLWTATYYALAARYGSRATERVGPAGIALLGIALTLSWALYIAPAVIDYLASPVERGLRELINIVTGHAGSRQLFRDNTGKVAPAWERVAQLASTTLILVGLVPGLYAVWRRYRTSAAAMALAGTALLFPLSLPLRFTEAGAEASDRAAGFAFIAVGFVLATAFDSALHGRWAGRWIRIVLTALTTLIFVGEVIVGAGPAWSRLPGPYLVSADARSIEPQGTEAAAWMRAFLGPDNRVATDRINGLLTGSLGEQYPTAHVNTGIDVAPVFFAPGFGSVQQGIIRQGKIRYLLVDLRLSTALPLEGVYIDGSEPEALQHRTPIAPAALAKFTRLVNLSQVYDGGAILIYRIGASTHEP